MGVGHIPPRWKQEQEKKARRQYNAFLKSRGLKRWKTFDGKKYHLRSHHGEKRIALTEAGRLRKRGYKIRIVKGVGRAGSVVWRLYKRGRVKPPGRRASYYR